MSDSPGSLTLLVRRLAREAHRRDLDFKRIVDRTAARMAQRSGLPNVLGWKSDMRLLEQVAKGEMSAAMLRGRSADAHLHLKAKLPAAENQVREKLDAGADSRELWHYAVSRIVEESGCRQVEADLERSFPIGARTPELRKDVRRTLAELEQRGFAEELSAELWARWAERCERIGLPRPAPKTPAPPGGEADTKRVPVTAETAAEVPPKSAVEPARSEPAKEAESPEPPKRVDAAECSASPQPSEGRNTPATVDSGACTATPTGSAPMVQPPSNQGGSVPAPAGVPPVPDDPTSAAEKTNGDGQREDARTPDHSDDFTSVLWFGTRYAFTKTQAACVKVLWAEWEKGTYTLSEKTIGETIGSASERYRLVHTFRNRDGTIHPAFGTMIQPSGKGIFRLAPTESPEDHR